MKGDYMKTRTCSWQIGLLALGMAVGLLSAGTGAAGEWVPVAMGWVGDQLRFEFNSDAGRTALRYSGPVPDPAHRIVATLSSQQADQTVTCEFELQYNSAAAVPAVVIETSGSVDLGALAPGAYTFVANSGGVSFKKVAFTVPESATPLADLAQPRISSVKTDGAEIVVEVVVPANVRKLTLESRTRLGAGAWTPRAVWRYAGQDGSVSFRLARSEKLEVLRVRADAQDALPASFYQGTNQFNGQTSASGPTQPPVTSVEAGPGANDAKSGGTGQTRTVVESDIWKLEGDMLYFFNQYRGLQVINLSVPDKPVVRGTLELPAAGEQMYLLDATHVVLLAGNGCGNWGDNSQVLVVDVSADQPRTVASVPVEGYIQESRLVGSALYVASQTYHKFTVQTSPGKPDSGVTEQWEWGTVVSSFDLAKPETPVAQKTLWYPGYGNVIMATDQYLFTATQGTSDWWRSIVHVVDINSPDGVMVPMSEIDPGGRVADKFKMNVEGDVFTVICEVRDWSGTGRQVSVLQTYSITDPSRPVGLGKLEVGHGEGLYATRFDGDRVYIVTFLRVDPLWVVDLKDPSAPKISGELKVPGWSTYIQPMGDRLVAVGIDNSNSWKVAVSLFDVRDPAKPGLLSKIPLGENYSWSEANYDEKALTVLPDSGLILVPYQGWSSNGYASRVQLIDLSPDTLSQRGVIEHEFQPRRATMHSERIISISGRELLTVNAADRDHPIVTAQTDLTWPVSQVLVSGDYLVEVSNGESWTGQSSPSLRVVLASTPNGVLNHLTLANSAPVVAACIRDGHLYVTQLDTTYVPILKAPPENGASGSENTNAPNLFLSIYDASALPELSLIGQTSAVTSSPGWGAGADLLWVKPGTLVMSVSGGGLWWGRGMLTDGLVAGGPIRWWWGGGGGHLVALDVRDPAHPAVVSDTILDSQNAWWGYSKTLVDNGLAYLSHQASEFLPGVLLPGQKAPEPVITKNPDGTITTNQPPIGIWVTRYYLEVVDFADPAVPTVRKPVNIPGQIQSVGRGGAILYTLGPHWDANGNTDWADYLDACAYDGVAATLVASLSLPTTWPRATLVANDTAYVAKVENGNQLEAWVLADAKQFTKIGSRTLALPAQNLVRINSILAAQSDRTIELYEASNPTDLTPLGVGTLPGCVWPDLLHADGSPSQGLWVPASDYGVFHVPDRK